MTDAEMLSRIYRAMKEIERSGAEFGKIELIVRGVEVKHVNVSYEILPDRNEEISSKS